MNKMQRIGLLACFPEAANTCAFIHDPILVNNQHENML